MSDEPLDEQGVAATAEARDLLVEVSRRHEEGVHGGEPCREHRIGLAAFVCHALGIRAAHVEELVEKIEELDRLHESRHGHRNGHPR